MKAIKAAQQIRQHASAAGLSPKDWAEKFNKFNPKPHTQPGPMTFDPISVKPPVELMAERMDNLQTHHYVDYTFFARWGAAQAVEALRHQWPEWITRDPTAEDADKDGWVQTLHEGRIDLTDFRHTNGQPWLHTPGWRPKPEPTLNQQAVAVKVAFWGHPGNWDASLGAALRALVESHGTPTSGGAVFLNGDDVLAIATELEGSNA